MINLIKDDLKRIYMHPVIKIIKLYTDDVRPVTTYY